MSQLSEVQEVEARVVKVDKVERRIAFPSRGVRYDEESLVQRFSRPSPPFRGPAPPSSSSRNSFSRPTSAAWDRATDAFNVNPNKTCLFQP